MLQNFCEQVFLLLARGVIKSCECKAIIQDSIDYGTQKSRARFCFYSKHMDR